MSFQSEKNIVREFLAKLDTAQPEAVASILRAYCSESFSGYASFPWRRLESASALEQRFLAPLKASFPALQRRETLFFAGANAGDGAVWVLSAGHYMGLFDAPWLEIPPTRKIAMIRYAEFHQVADGKVEQSAIFVDVIGVMQQAGFNPLPNETGHFFVYPGPKTNDGVLLSEQDSNESEKTSALIDEMVDDLDVLNRSGNDNCPPELLARTWHEDMVWYGPAGIGATMTIPRYQEQHQHPFRQGLKNKVFNGHVCRIAEGTYAGFFGWPNLRNTAAGFLGVAETDVHAEMQVVDLYRRDGDRLAENWVLIDLPYWLIQQGIDVFADMRAHFNL